MPRIKRVLKWIGVTLAVLVSMLLLANAWYVSTASRRLEDKLARLRTDGEPLSLADLVRPSIPEEQNAWALLRQLSGEVASVREQLASVAPQNTNAALDDAVQRAEIGRHFEEHATLFERLDRASRCADYVPEMRADLSHTQFLEQTLLDTGESREVFRLLALRVNWLLAEGRRDEAFETALTQLRFARHLRRNPLVVWHLVIMACQHTAFDSVNHVLNAGPLSDEQQKSLDAELALFDSRDGYRWALTSERASALTALREMPGFNFWISRGFACDGASHLVDLIDEYLAAVDRPYAEFVAKTRLGRPRATGINAYRAVVDLLQPALDVTREPTERLIAYGRALRVVNLLPSTPDAKEVPPLDQLGLPAAAVMDPFSSQPLRVKRVEEGWRVYSVGKNGVDDGGNAEAMADICAGR